jgi:hypothetical protein
VGSRHWGMKLLRNICWKVNISSTLYIKISMGYTPEGTTEKNALISTQKRNLLLRNRLADHNLNKEVSNE